MTESVNKIIGLLLAGWVGAVGRHATAVLLALTCGTLAVAVFTATHLGVNADEDAMLSNELPHRVFELEYHEIFPVLYENIVIVVDGQSPDAAADFAQALATRMETMPEVFHSVYLPRDDFFDENSLLYLDTEELEDFADRLAQIQPYLAGIARYGTLRGLASMLARGVRAVRDGDISGQELVAMLDRFGRATRAQLENSEYHLAWAEVVADRELGADDRRRIILAQPVLDFSDLAPARSALTAVRQLSAELDIDESAGIRVRVTGDAALAFEEMQIVEDQAILAGAVSFLMVGVVLLLGLRSLRLVFATLVTLVVGLVWTAGFAAVAIGHLNLISVAFAVLFIGLGVDFGVHLCMRYYELVVRGASRAEAMRETSRGVGTSLVLCAVTTAIGFFAFVPTDFSGVAELGLISGAGMFVSLICSFTVLPALLAVCTSASWAERVTSRPKLGAALPTFPLRHPRTVGSLALLLGAGAVFFLPGVRFDENPLNVRDPSAESVQILEELLAKGTAAPWELNAVAPSLEIAEELSAELKKLESVERAITVADYIPGDQDEKLEIIEDVALFLPLPQSKDGVPSEPSLEEQLEALRQLQLELDRWLRDGGTEEFLASARFAHRQLTAFLSQVSGSPQGWSAVAELEESLLGSLPAQLASLERIVSPGRIVLDDLPAALLERMISKEGRIRVRIFPSEDLSDPEALGRFVNEVRTVVPQVAGGAVKIYEAGRAVVRALRQAFIAAIVMISVLLLVIWRTLGDTALVLIPLGLAALLTTAATVLLDIPFNFADVIVLPLLLGIGVDSGIHLVHRSRMLRREEGHLLETSTARAVIYSAVTTIASFGSLAFASHRGMASLGQLLTLGVVFTTLCNLLLLPALIELRARRRQTPPPRSSAEVVLDV